MIDPENISGAVLAGGESTRMGQNKALLEIKGGKLIRIAVDNLRHVFSDVFVAGPRALQAFVDVPVYEDIYKGFGPIAGLHTAFSYASHSHIFILSVDMPFINRKIIRQICESSSPDKVNLPVCGNPQPLCAIYPSHIRLNVEYLLINTHNPESAGSGLSLLQLARLKGNIIKLAGYENKFFNINTPADLEKARKFIE
jgi:molybdopterin-guanine dinucleotide biosynthesis protein A